MESGKKTFKAALRVSGTSVSVSEIENVFGVSATDGSRKHHVWIYDSGLADGEELSEHLCVLLELLENSDWSYLTKIAGMHIDLFCMYGAEDGQGSMTLDSSLLKRLAAQGINLTLDLYPPTS
ncbi:MAG TPA: DUF4279 domain-containing protein [Chthoniobacteraceae bacterium]|nr:DUF4279 domain-containing protein [Chthoniobacteraceae bacterium]